MERKCPFCRRVISTEDNYCPYCGYNLKKSEDQEKKIEETREHLIQDENIPKPVPLKGEPSTKPEIKEPEIEEPEQEIEVKEEEIKIPEEIIEQYYIKIKVKQLDEKLKEYKEKINYFLSELNEEELEEIKDEIPKLKESVNKLKAKKKALLADKRPIPQEELLNKRAKLKKQLSNLNNKFYLKEIEPTVYERLKAEYQARLNEINGKIDFPINSWKKILKKNIKDKEEQLIILEGRFKVSELSKNEYEREKLKLNEKIEKLHFLLSELKI
ncbi:MAG: hypothetical protein ACTSRG_13455 [Candidatus Helarchaeota archaeon]